MTKDEIIFRLLELREDAVYDEIVKGCNDHTTKEFQFALGKEEAVCTILNALIEAGDLAQDTVIAAFERGRDRGWAARSGEVAAN